MFLPYGWFFAKIEKINRQYLRSASTVMLHIRLFALNILHDLLLVFKRYILDSITCLVVTLTALAFSDEKTFASNQLKFTTHCAWQRYRKGHGFKSRTGPNFFFWSYFHYFLSGVHHCRDRFQIYSLIRSSHIRF